MSVALLKAAFRPWIRSRISRTALSGSRTSGSVASGSSTPCPRSQASSSPRSPWSRPPWKMGRSRRNSAVDRPTDTAATRPTAASPRITAARARGGGQPRRLSQPSGEATRIAAK